MKTQRLPKFDSIRKLAEFWDTHDLTDFEDKLEVVNEPVFIRDTAVKVDLQSKEAVALRKLARQKGVSQSELIRQWILPKLVKRGTGQDVKRNGK